MANRRAGVVLAILLSLPLASWAARHAHAENQMGYRLLSAQEAAALPRNQGALGLDVERAQQITDAGITFDLMRVKQVRQGSAGARAGFRRGDQIIAVDGLVFPSIAAFAAYIGSVAPGNRVSIDYMPAGSGPANAERVPVTLGAAGRTPQNYARENSGGETGSGGMSTRMKIGIGAAALFGCYELGCFSRSKPAAPAGNQQPYSYR